MDTGTAGLTAAEQAYFDSRGAKTVGLDLGDAGTAATVEAPKPGKATAGGETSKSDAAAKPDVAA